MNDKKEKHVRIALAVLPEQRHFTTANNLAATLKLAEQAGEAKCDLIAFEENGIHLFTPPEEKFPPVPGPQTDAIARIAKKHNMYIAASMTGTVDGIKRKLMVLFNRDGEIADIYSKQQLTDGEKNTGAVEGDVCRPIETDFGRIAFLICYDTQFPALSQMLGAQRTDLIICPHVGGAGGNGGKLLGGAFASQNHCWLAWVGRYVTSMINPSGNEVSKLKIEENLLITDIELNPRRIIPSTMAPIVDRKEQQYTQSRHNYYNCPFPAIIAEFPEYPTYSWNQLPLGRKSFELVLRNRTNNHKKGSVNIVFPLKCTYNSN
ncbi:MAG: carbon-nitrogen hydrolase family protein, partial [Victivallales bacterium]|nr:carbon-nitrogen hydrolase family protein [Victivallales bacterium]